MEERHSKKAKTRLKKKEKDKKKGQKCTKTYKNKEIFYHF